MKLRVLLSTLLLAGTGFLVAPAGGAPVEQPCTTLVCVPDLPCDPATLQCTVPSPCRAADCVPDACAQGVCEPVPDVVPPADRLPVTPLKPCRDRYGVVYIADEFDNFGSPAASSPSAALQAWMNTLPNGQRGFDEWGSNKRFGHTFTGLAGNVDSAVLTIHIHATDDYPLNDGIAFQMGPPGVFDSGAAFVTEVPLQTGQSWPYDSSGGYTDATLSFNLATVSPTLLSSIGSTGSLDVYVQDDTVIDYITLEIWWCKCGHAPVSWLVEQGTQDSFAGPEPTTYRWTPQPRQYDDGGADRAFATSLELPRTDCLESATVEISTRVENQLVSTDWIHFQYTGSAFLDSQPAPLGINGQVNLVTVTFPANSAVLQDMAATGFFDVYIQDDTAIDYVRLILNYA